MIHFFQFESSFCVYHFYVSSILIYNGELSHCFAANLKETSMGAA